MGAPHSAHDTELLETTAMKYDKDDYEKWKTESWLVIARVNLGIQDRLSVNFCRTCPYSPLAPHNMPRGVYAKDAPPECCFHRKSIFWRLIGHQPYEP